MKDDVEKRAINVLVIWFLIIALLAPVMLLAIFTHGYGNFPIKDGNTEATARVWVSLISILLLISTFIIEYLIGCAVSYIFSGEADMFSGLAKFFNR